MTLSWDAVTGATAYQIYRADTADGTLTRIAEDTTITDTAHTDTGLTHSTTYRYTVRTVDNVGISADSSEASATTRGLPAAPANLSATASGAADAFQVSLSWDAVTGATAYQIYRADTADGTLTRIAENTTITDAAYADTGLTHSTTYRYTVRAVDSIGISVDSSAASATTPALPVAPENVGAAVSVAGSDLRVTLTWDAVIGVTAYQIYRADTADGTLTRIAQDTTITDTAYTDTGLTHSTTYRYTVRAVDSVGTSIDSFEASITTPALPAAPENLTAGTGALSVLLSWDAVPGATEYRVYRASTTTAPRSRIASGTTITATSYTDTGLTDGTTYRYTVRAVNNIGEGTDSNEVDAAPDDHGNVLAGATPVTPGVAVNGNIALAWDIDYFSIEITGASASAPVTLDATAPGAVNTDGTLFNSSGTQIGSDDYNGADNDFRIIRSLTENGTYYIRVHGKGGARGTYTLTITTDATVIDTDDHRNIRSGATPVTSGTAVSGTLNVAGDFDYFSIAVTGASPGSSVTLGAETTGSVDTYGVLFDSNGTEIATNDDRGDYSNFEIVHPITENGTYYIRVGGFDHAETGDYSLTVTAQ